MDRRRLDMDGKKVQMEIQGSGNGEREERCEDMDREQQSDDRMGMMVLGRKGRDVER